MQSDRKYDIVVFGATGFTGQRVLRELVAQGSGCVNAVYAGCENAVVTCYLRSGVMQLPDAVVTSSAKFCKPVGGQQSRCGPALTNDLALAFMSCEVLRTVLHADAHCRY